MMNIRKASPQILTILGVVGLIGTVVMAVKATPKCEELLEKAEKRLKEETPDIEEVKLGKKETLKCFAKAYWSAAAMGVITTACFVASNYVSGKREAVMATAFGLSEAALKQFQQSTLEVVGDKTYDQIKGKVADAKLAESKIKNVVPNDNRIVTTGEGETLFYDPYIDRYFRHDLQKVRETVINLNERLFDEEFICVNDLYYDLRLHQTKYGDDFGWHCAYNGGGKIEIDYAARISEWGEPCIVLGYTVEPAYWRPEFR